MSTSTTGKRGAWIWAFVITWLLIFNFAVDPLATDQIFPHGLWWSVLFGVVYGVLSLVLGAFTARVVFGVPVKELP